MIDEYFLRVRFNRQNQIRYLHGKDILVLHATVQPEDSPASLFKGAVLCRIAFLPLRARVREAIVHLHGETTGRTGWAVHNDHRDVHFVPAEDVLEVVTDYHVPLDLKDQQCLPEEIPDSFFSFGTE